MDSLGLQREILQDTGFTQSFDNPNKYTLVVSKFDDLGHETQLSIEVLLNDRTTGETKYRKKGSFYARENGKQIFKREYTNSFYSTLKAIREVGLRNGYPAELFKNFSKIY